MNSTKKINNNVLSFLLAIVLAFTTMPLHVNAASGDTTVYVTRTGDKYHRSSCSYLRKSKIAITLQEAIDNGYGICTRCIPPKLDDPTQQVESVQNQVSATSPVIVPDQNATEQASEKLDDVSVPAPTTEMQSSSAASYAMKVQTEYMDRWSALSEEEKSADAILTQRIVLIMQLSGLPAEQAISQMDLVTKTQIALIRAGYSPEINGLLDLYTTQALISYQTANGLNATGVLDSDTIISLGIV